MSYQALYRKWRPDTFDKIIGQDAVVRTLKNQVVSDRIGHAYLFCGTRGTGKTSAAKILARAANCRKAAGNGGSPCNSCEVCRSILDGSGMNVFEIDAASNNGVDNIRDIRDETEYPPVTGRYKVYIIDEVHMLSSGAFNALLKTLEEPPAYVIFILATTDPQKVPATILSRCQRYDFRRIPAGTIYRQLADIAAGEGFDIEDRALKYMADAGDGSMRDAVSILEQCIAYHPDRTLKYDEVLDILGTADTVIYSRLLGDIARHDVKAALMTVSELIGTGADIIQLINEFIWYLRNVLLAGSVDEKDRDLLDISEEAFERAGTDAGRIDKLKLMDILSTMAELVNRARYSPQKRVLFEVEVIRLCTIGQAPAHGVRENSPQEKKPFRNNVQETVKPAAGNKTVPQDTGSDIDILMSHWEELVAGLHPSNRPLFSGVVLKEEKGIPVLLFRNNMNYRLAANNIEENGVLKLRSMAARLLGHDIRLMARAARPGELKTGDAVITDEDLAGINFHVDIDE